ncbi:MAG TPA: prolyl oligopeptidase family serine peptidase [Polyangiaceae bacterium]|nr:prolyl oligopeptidase family serine peptidase [Polyangiaceae bacterium]
MSKTNDITPAVAVDQATIERRFGVVVADPHRWLEDGDSERVRAWTDAQNARTDEYLAACPTFAELRARVAALLRVGYCDLPTVRRGRAFYQRREGDAQQPALRVREPDGNERVLIDAEALSPDATDALDWWYPSPSGKLVAWGRSSAGSEQSVLFVRDVETGRDLPGSIPNTQHGVVGWVSDTRFFYTRFPAPGTVPPGEEQYHGKLYVHELGADPASDELVFEPGAKSDVPQAIVSPDGRWLVVLVAQGWAKSEVYLRDLADPAGVLVPVATNEEAIFEPIARRDGLYLLTNSGAPRYRVFAVDYARPARDGWKELLPETDDVLASVAITSSRIVACYLRNASSVVVARDRAAPAIAREVALPTIGTAAVHASSDDEGVYVSFTSFVVPLGVHRLEGAALVPWAVVSEGVPREGVRVERLFATSKDGTRVPMFVVSREDARWDGDNPTVLYGYGGFNVNQTPAFSARVLSFVQRGGVWVSSVLRGGGEYGEAWHRAGMLENKQNVFDDFYACAEALVAARVTRPERLAAVGGSNGGLLVSVAITQRPELFGAGIALVPLTDMLRYPLFRLGAFWVPEYGSPDDEAAFRVLYAYSPYHHVRPGVGYPAMLLWAAESDSRVDPMHARKMAAALLDAGPSNPVLLRVETKAGHGMGKPTSKVADQLAAELAFLDREIGKNRGGDP